MAFAPDASIWRRCKIDHAHGAVDRMTAARDTGIAQLLVEQRLAMATIGHAIINQQLTDDVARTVGTVSDHFRHIDVATVTLDTLARSRPIGAIMTCFT